MKLQNPIKTITAQFTRRFSDLDWRFLLCILPPLSLLLFVSLSYISAATSTEAFAPIKSWFYSGAAPQSGTPITSRPEARNESETDRTAREWKEELDRSRMAVCLVGGARRFELTGPSIVQKILKVYPNSDLFLHSPLDSNSYKFSLLKIAPKIASVRIFEPKPIPETETQNRVLTAHNSPNGIQGLLQYFNLVEGCLTMIKDYQEQHNFTYHWIVRTRVDGYWSAPLQPDNFVPGQYVVPPGSSYGGLNDRLGIGDLNSSIVALSRLALIPKLDSAGFHQLNSETSFMAQLTSQNVSFLTKPLPFCVVTDRKYEFPPSRFGVPVAAISTAGPLSGAKCRPCTEACSGSCAAEVMDGLYRGWSWFDSTNVTLRLCNAHSDWEKGWEEMFDRTAGNKLAAARKRVRELGIEQCIYDFEEMRGRVVGKWEAPPAEKMCMVGLGLDH